MLGMATDGRWNGVMTSARDDSESEKTNYIACVSAPPGLVSERSEPPA